jgi:hypothetical protein
MARKLTLRDLEAAGIPLESWHDRELRGQAAAEDRQVQKLQMFEHQIKNAELLARLASSARHYRGRAAAFFFLVTFLSSLVPSRAAWLTGTFTNQSTLQGDTNVVKILSLGPMLANGTYFTEGIPQRITPGTNGAWLINLGPGNYQATNAFLGQGIYFYAPNDLGSNVYSVAICQIPAPSTFPQQIILSLNATSLPVTYQSVTGSLGYVPLSPGVTNNFDTNGASTNILFQLLGSNYVTAVGVTNIVQSIAPTNSGITALTATNIANSAAAAAQQNATNFANTIGANATNYAASQAIIAQQNGTNFALIIGANATNFSNSIGVNGTNYTTAQAAAAQQNSTNFANTIGANATNYAASQAIIAQQNATNFANIIGANNTNYINSQAANVQANATNFANTIGAHDTNYVNSQAANVQANSTNFANTIGVNGTNYTTAQAAAAQQNSTNFANSIGANATNYAASQAIIAQQNATNFANIIGANDTNYINSQAANVQANATNFANTIGAHDTNYINSQAANVQANSTNFANMIGVNGTNYTTAQVTAAQQNATNFSNAIGANGTNYTTSQSAIAQQNSTNFANTIGVNATNYANLIAGNLTNAIAATNAATLAALLATNTALLGSRQPLSTPLTEFAGAGVIASNTTTPGADWRVVSQSGSTNLQFVLTLSGVPLYLVNFTPIGDLQINGVSVFSTITNFYNSATNLDLRTTNGTANNLTIGNDLNAGINTWLTITNSVIAVSGGFYAQMNYPFLQQNSTTWTNITGSPWSTITTNGASAVMASNGISFLTASGLTGPWTWIGSSPGSAPSSSIGFVENGSVKHVTGSAYYDSAWGNFNGSFNGTGTISNAAAAATAGVATNLAFNTPVLTNNQTGVTLGLNSNLVGTIGWNYQTNQNWNFPQAWPHYKTLSPAATIQAPTFGGSGASLSDLPPSPAAMSQLQRGPWFLTCLTWGNGALSGGGSGFDTNTTETVFTNFVRTLIASGLPAALTAAGIPNGYWFDEPFMPSNRDVNFNLTFNTNKYPDCFGNNAFCVNYLHTNGLLAGCNIYFSPVEQSNDWEMFPFYSPPNNQVPMITGPMIWQDFTNLMAWGMDNVTLADVSDMQVGYYDRMVRMACNADLFPMGNESWTYSQNPYHGMSLNVYHQDWSTQPQDAAYVNGIFVDTGIAVPSIFANPHWRNDMWLIRNWWTNYSPYISPGHYGAVFVISFQSTNPGVAYEDLTMPAICGGQILFGPTTNFNSDINWQTNLQIFLTNATYLKALANIQGSFYKLYDFSPDGTATNAIACLYRPTPVGTFVLMDNDSLVTTNMGFTFQSLGLPNVCDVQDVWAWTNRAKDLGVQSVYYSNSLPSVSPQFLFVTPVWTLQQSEMVLTTNLVSTNMQATTPLVGVQLTNNGWYDLNFYAKAQGWTASDYPYMLVFATNSTSAGNCYGGRGLAGQNWSVNGVYGSDMAGITTGTYPLNSTGNGGVYVNTLAVSLCPGCNLQNFWGEINLTVNVTNPPVTIFMEAVDNLAYTHTNTLLLGSRIKVYQFQ